MIVGLLEYFRDSKFKTRDTFQRRYISLDFVNTRFYECRLENTTNAERTENQGKLLYREKTQEKTIQKYNQQKGTKLT